MRYLSKLVGLGLSALVVVCGLTGCKEPAVAQQSTQAQAAKAKHLVIIGVDAMSPDGILNAKTPVLDRLMKSGSYTFNARGVLPTSSSTNWKSMMSGSGPEQHGVTSNFWERDDYNFAPVTTGMENIFPTLFGQYRQQNADAKIAAIYAWDGFGRLIERSALNYDVAGESDEKTTSLAAEYLVKEKPELLFVHLDWVDHIGHEKGHKTPEFYAAIEQIDSQIGQIVQAAESADLLKDTVFIITSDHGGIGLGHGGESLDELEIPFIIFGPGIKADHVIKQPVYTYDTAATVAYILGFEAHPAWIGRAVRTAFVGEAEPTSKVALVPTNTLAAPVLAPKAGLYEAAGGLFAPEQAKLVIHSSVEGAEIRYSLDGSEPTRDSTLYQQEVLLKQSAIVKARHFKGQTEQSGIATGFYHLIPDNPENGIHYKYYEDDRWQFLPALSALTPVSTGTTYQFRVNDIAKSRGNFGISYSAWIKIDVAGQHKFYTYSDDGSKLYIDDQEVVNNDGDHGTLERAGVVELTPGMHKIRVDYFNAGGGYWLEVFHKAPGQPKQIIKPELLFLNPPAAGN